MILDLLPGSKPTRASFMKPLATTLLVLVTASAFIACRTKATASSVTDPASENVATSTPAGATSLSENFETGGKTSYAAADVTLSSGSWTFDDALIGNLPADAKTGSAAARIRNIGSLTMNFNANGAGTVSISHGTYGSDGSSTWQLWYSVNNGKTYKQAGGMVTSSSNTLQTAVFTLNVSGTVRLSIRKIGGGTNRLNIDNIIINTSGVTGGTTEPGNTNGDKPGGNKTDETTTGHHVPGKGNTGGTKGSTGDNSHLLMGNPSGAVASTSSPTNYLMNETYYSISYNNAKGTPNWVSWHLNKADIGSTPRRDEFRPNTALPAGWYQVNAASYASSGFDRGHNCPSGDRTSSTAANAATFLMTNMIPQAPSNNQKTWNNMEVYIRSLVNAGNEVYIIMGSYGIGGTGSNGGVTKTLDNGRVTVPSHVWKVIVVIPDGNDDIKRITSATRVIAVNTPNINSISPDWKKYRTSVDAIEAATGYDLLSSLPISVQQVIEARIDNE